MTKMYHSPFGEGLSIKGYYLCVKNRSDEEKLSLSPEEGVTPSVREGLAVYISI